MFWRRFTVPDRQRVVIAKNGHFRAILTPGEHRIFAPFGGAVAAETHDLRDVVFQSAWADELLAKHPDVVNRHLTRIETNEFQVGMIYADGKLLKVLPPAELVLVWRDAAEITVELVEVIAEPDTPADAIAALERLAGRNNLDSLLIEEVLEIGSARGTQRR